MSLFAAVERIMSSTACLGGNEAIPVFKAAPSASADIERGDRHSIFGVLQPRDGGRMKCGNHKQEDSVLKSAGRDELPLPQIRFLEGPNQNISELSRVYCSVPSCAADMLTN